MILHRDTPAGLAARWAADDSLTQDERAQLLELLAGQLRHHFAAPGQEDMWRRAKSIEILAGQLRTSLATRDKRRADFDRALGNNPRGPRLRLVQPSWKLAGGGEAVKRRRTPSVVSLAIEIADTTHTYLRVREENESAPYRRRTVIIELTPEQRKKLVLDWTGTINGVDQFEEILSARLEWPVIYSSVDDRVEP